MRFYVLIEKDLHSLLTGKKTTLQNNTYTLLLNKAVFVYIHIHIYTHIYMMYMVPYKYMCVCCIWIWECICMYTHTHLCMLTNKNTKLLTLLRRRQWHFGVRMKEVSFFILYIYAFQEKNIHVLKVWFKQILMLDFRIHLG